MEFFFSSNTKKKERRMSSEESNLLQPSSEVVIKDLQHADQTTIVYVSSRNTRDNEASVIACITNNMKPNYDVIINEVWRKTSATQIIDFPELNSSLTIYSAVRRSADEPQYYGKNCVIFDLIHCLCGLPVSKPIPVYEQTIVRIRLDQNASEDAQLQALGILLDNLPKTVDLSSVAVPYDFGVECDYHQSKSYRELISDHHMFKNTTIVFHRRQDYI